MPPDMHGVVTSYQQVALSADAIRAEGKQAHLPDTVAYPSCNVAGKPITDGARARCFAQYMRIHTLEITKGVPYALMGRFVAKPGAPNSTTSHCSPTSSEPTGSANSGATHIAAPSPNC